MLLTSTVVITAAQKVTRIGKAMTTLTDWISQQQFYHQRKQNAWNRALPVIGYDQDKVRKDAYGSFIVWNEYGQQTTYGWEIDHELPRAHFPTIAAQPSNQRALHWRNNRTKSDKIDMNTIRRIAGGL